MAGTISQDHERRGDIGVITCTCTGDAADGSFPATTLDVKISGRLLALETNPSAVAPSANYDITLVDNEGLDVLHSCGLNRHTSTTEKVPIVFGTYFNPPVEKSDDLVLTITGNSVNSAVIVVKLYYQGTSDE